MTTSAVAAKVKKYLLTKDGLKKLQAELKFLIEVRRKEVIERIREAAAHCDLSENADYSQAREEQSFVEGRILEIEDILRNAEIIVTPAGHAVVAVGSTVTVKVDNKERKYTIVGSNEANPGQGRISNESTVGRALLGKRVGDKVKVKAPAGEVEYEVLEIE